MGQRMLQHGSGVIWATAVQCLYLFQFPRGSVNRVTAIIPTKNRSASVLAVIKSLAAQTRPPDEIVIVDQTPKRDSTEETVRNLLPQSVHVKYLRNSNLNGAAAARNVAMRHATGDILLFLDDDVTLYPDFIERMLVCYEEFPDATGISGMPDNYSPPGRFFYYWTKVFARGAFWNDRFPIFWNPKAITSPVRVAHMTSAMMSVKTSELNGVFFDENVPGADAEDVDFCVCLKGIYYVDPRCKMTHHFAPQGREKDHWTRRHARCHTYLYLKDWHDSKLAYAWLNVGWLVAASLGCVSRRSLQPLRAMLKGRAEGRACVPARTATGGARQI